MILRTFATFYLLFALALYMPGCSSSSDIASGTGVGNPGITKVSIVADKGYDTNSPYSSPVTPTEIPIYDDGGLLFTVTAISINIHYINFIESTIDGQEQGPMTLNPPLKQAFDIKLDGPFLFDAMSGLSMPPIDSFSLPPGKYAEMRVYIINKTDPNAPYAVELSGYFDYSGKKRDFTFKLQNNKLASYKYKGPAFTITAQDSTLFTLVLTAERWLESVNMAESLENNALALDQAGNLVIDNTVNSESAEKLKNSISHSIIKSGYLLITPLD